ncbi:MAG: hypothetical protein MZV63_61570 [Marinilabiliales bacterium]|nr:hypothetical protein [Marinilabiliales bacterium]
MIRLEQRRTCHILLGNGAVDLLRIEFVARCRAAGGGCASWQPQPTNAMLTEGTVNHDASTTQ